MTTKDEIIERVLWRLSLTWWLVGLMGGFAVAGIIAAICEHHQFSAVGPLSLMVFLIGAFWMLILRRSEKAS